ncbi:TCR/Tet family MFS transporter [Vibrio fluvialis]
MNKPLIVIYIAIAIDAVGIGIMFPILPALLKNSLASDDVAIYLGLMTTIYAGAQFIFSPFLGALGDKMGRRPVLLTSLAGTGVSYLLLAMTSNVYLFFVGRLIAGMTSANMAVAIAYLSDISTPNLRAKRLGMLNAMFGVGFIIGPIMGGILGDYWIKLPFIVAICLTTGNFILALFVLPESKQNHPKPIERIKFNPIIPLRWALSSPKILSFMLSFFILSATGEAYGVCWALWGSDAVHWNGFWIGASLGMFGLCQAIVQAFLTHPISIFLGERKTVMLGILCACLSLTALAFANEGWQVFVVMPLFALSGVGTPALQSLASQQVVPKLQGQLQGTMMSMVSLASIFAPLCFSAVYNAFHQQWPGAIWLSVVVIYMMAIPFVSQCTRNNSY